MEQGIAYMKAYKDLFGHLNIHSQYNANIKEFKSLVKDKYIVNGDYKLGPWVVNLRQRMKKIKPEYKKEIENLGFVWKPLVGLGNETYPFL